MSAVGANTLGLNAEQREIAALLEEEFVELVDYAQSTFSDKEPAFPGVAKSADEPQQEALDNFQLTLEHIASAVEMAGLLGLADSCRHLIENFSIVGNGDIPITSDLFNKLQSWPTYFLRYLQEINDRQTSVEVATGILDFLSDRIWPLPLEESQRQDILGRFQASHFSIDDDSAQTVPTTATDAMVSLDTGEDARAELIESMLIELPRQTQELESSVNRYLKTHDIGDLTQARRMAHTLKGSANIVGIQGIANLMHYSEDILEIVSKQPIEQIGDLEELLLNVSDTLAMMTEYLTGVGPAPEDARDVLQDVLDFTRTLKGQSAATIEGDVSAKQVVDNKEILTQAAEHDDRTLNQFASLQKSDQSRIECGVNDDTILDSKLVNVGPSNDEVSRREFASEISQEKSIDELIFANLDFGDSDPGLRQEDEAARPDLRLDDESGIDEVKSDPSPSDDLLFDDDFLSGGVSGLDAFVDSSDEAFLFDETLSDDAFTGDFLVEPATLNENLSDEWFSDEDLFASDEIDEDQFDDISEVANTNAISAGAGTLAKQNVSNNSEHQFAAAGDESTQTADDENADENYRLSVPLGTAQELLRIAGETQITNAQIESQIAAMRANVKSTELYQLRLRNMANELESLVQTQNALRAASMKYTESEIDPIEMERYSELDTFSNQLVELTTDAHEAIAHVEEQLRELATISYTQQQLNKDNQGMLLRLRMIPVEVMSSRFARCVRQASRLSKKTIEFSLEGSQLLVDSMVLNRIVDPLLHLLRNAVDHGIEDSDEDREAAGKPLTGKIILRFEQRGETLTIDCSDDGRGLDYTAIREKAVANGIISLDARPGQQELEHLILLPGFSTRESATQTSGRGIGLDAVVADVKALKGVMAITSEQSQGSTFRITVPTSILTGHALLARCSSRLNSQVLSIVSRNIDQIIYVSSKQIIKRAEGLAILHDEELLSLYNLNDLVNLYPEYNDTITAVLITQRPGGQKIGIGVEALLASQDMVVKPLNKFVYHPPGIVGATILGDGTVSPVIDLQELPGVSMTTEEWERWRGQIAQANRLRDKSRDDVPLALIVDDSLSARRSLVQFVTDMGMEAITAKDGFEAINVVNERKPSIMLVDLEMPRMNGLELTSHLRSRADMRDIPVIMITSRTTEKHRTMAENAGVNTYLNKPWSEEELMECIEKELHLQM